MDVTDRLTIGERVKLVREAKGMTQAELAARLNVGREAVASYETGRREIRASAIEDFARALDVVPTAFFDQRWDEIADARRLVLAQAQAIFNEAKKGAAQHEESLSDGGALSSSKRYSLASLSELVGEPSHIARVDPRVPVLA